jgi:plasmid stabilization system protein ParE
MDVVATAPYIGRERPDFSGNPRSIVVRPYVIFYKPFAEGDGIHVWRVLHGARNIPRILRPPA